MRLILVLAVICLAACASDELRQAPPAGVDFSGRWKLNIADSDDPQRLLQAQLNARAPGQGGSGGGGRPGGGRSGAGAAGAMGSGPGGPMMPSVGELHEGLRWPGKQLEIKQVGGVVAFTSDGVNRICQPSEGRKLRGHRTRKDRDGAAPARSRDTSPPLCGWMEKTLIVQAGQPDDDRPPFEERYSLSEDGARLIEVVGFKGGRSNGFTMSRVWDRSAP